jgi:hypothetical protein
MIDKQPKSKLGLPRTPPKAQVPPAPPRPVDDSGGGYGQTLRAIIEEELERAAFNKTAAFEATMARITADPALFQRLATLLLGNKCRKRIKEITRARNLALAQKKESGETE